MPRMRFWSLLFLILISILITCSCDDNRLPEESITDTEGQIPSPDTTPDQEPAPEQNREVIRKE